MPEKDSSTNILSVYGQPSPTNIMFRWSMPGIIYISIYLCVFMNIYIYIYMCVYTCIYLLNYYILYAPPFIDVYSTKWKYQNNPIFGNLRENQTPVVFSCVYRFCLNTYLIPAYHIRLCVCVLGSTNCIVLWSSISYWESLW
jgi:hypothetical protein